MVDRTQTFRRRREALGRLIQPFQAFFHAEASSGILLLAAAAAALVLANSPLAERFHRLWEIHLVLGVDGFELDESLHHWINDGLMAVFFFVVGLEIKRELMVGELSTRRKATLPVAAALGGMIVPGALYAAINWGGPGSAGWGIPMATDIAFALGVLYLLGDRVPVALRVFLAAIAIADDIGAVLVIAVFYTDDLSVASLMVAAVFFTAMMAANRLGIRHPTIYFLLGFGLWVAMLESGVHATVAGVLAAFTIPARTRIDSSEFVSRAREMIDRFEREGVPGRDVFSTEGQRAALQNLEDAAEKAESPLQRLEDGLHPWVGFVIMPLFALANAGVHLGGELIHAFGDAITWGIVIGLVAGKQVGVLLASWLVVRLGLASRPAEVGWLQIYGVGWLAGIGFTMSLFITNLAFDGPESITMAKTGVLAASLVAGIVGWTLLRATGRGVPGAPAPSGGATTGGESS